MEGIETVEVPQNCHYSICILQAAEYQLQPPVVCSYEFTISSEWLNEMSLTSGQNMHVYSSLLAKLITNSDYLTSSIGLTDMLP